MLIERTAICRITKAWDSLSMAYISTVNSRIEDEKVFITTPPLNVERKKEKVHQRRMSQLEGTEVGRVSELEKMKSEKKPTPINTTELNDYYLYVTKSEYDHRHPRLGVATNETFTPK